MRFLVSQAMFPGACVPRLGFLQVGTRFTWTPVGKHKPNARWTPCDAEAYEALVAAWGAERIAELHGDGPALPVVPVVSPPGGEGGMAADLPNDATIGPPMTVEDAAAVASPEVAVSRAQRKRRAADE